MTLGQAAAMSPLARPSLLTPLRVVAALVGLAVFVQAIFAGQGLFIDTDNLDIHGMIGNLTLLLALAQAGLVFFAGFPRRDRTSFLIRSLVLLVLVVAQLGLGYSGRDGGTAAALHIPNGVAIMGLAASLAASLFGYRPDATPR
jgi:hypothetical protein